MQFFTNLYKGITIKRPTYREIDGSKIIDLYPSKVLFIYNKDISSFYKWKHFEIDF